MRVLFSSTGGDGHLLPLLPLAGAFAARGDEVLVAAPRSQRGRVETAGLSFAEAGATAADLADAIEAHQRRVVELPVEQRRPLAFSGRFGELEAPARLEALRAIVDAWRPELVVHESADLAAPIAASEARIPFVHHAFGRPIPERALRQAAEAVAPLWQAVGLEPDPLAGAYCGSYVDICPPSLRAPLPQQPLRTFLMQPVEPPARQTRSSERPVLYATLGTTFNELSTFRLLLDALETIECNVVMTIGNDRSPADLGPIPSNATVVSYIPQAEILRDCDAVVSHGGSGSFLAALAHGRPLVLLPRGADQFDNAEACVGIGAAERVLPAEATVERIRSSIVEVLAGPGYAAAARAVAAEIAAMPSAAVVAGELADAAR